MMHNMVAVGEEVASKIKAQKAIYVHANHLQQF